MKNGLLNHLFLFGRLDGAAFAQLRAEYPDKVSVTGQIAIEDRDNYVARAAEWKAATAIRDSQVILFEKGQMDGRRLKGIMQALLPEAHQLDMPPEEQWAWTMARMNLIDT